MAEFTWGDLVKVESDAPPQLQPDELGSVCSIREVETPDQEVQLGGPIGSRVYLVEFGDGEAMEIPEAWLEYG